MKRILITVSLLSLMAAGVSRAQDDATPDTLVWCGLDYSKVKMIGTADFLHPEQIFPGMLVAWNGLFMTEMLPQLEKKASPSPVRTDLKAVEAANQKASASQIEREDGTADEKVKPSHITDTDIAKMVKNYDMKYKQGTGLVFIMDRLVKAQETGCLYVVYFDVASRKVIHSERVVAKGGGIGFRNFWFTPVKTAVKGLNVKQVKAIK
jgi:hypothetical protein